MNKIESLENVISEIGLTDLANLLSKKVGKNFTAQQINNWRKRGVPYKWHDAFVEVSGLSKSEIRQSEQQAA